MLRWGTIVLVGLTPLLYFSVRVFPHISSKTFFFYGAVEIVFFTWLYSILIDPLYRFSRKTWVYFLPLVLYGVWMTIAGILAPNQNLAFIGTLGRGTGIITTYHVFALVCIVASLSYRYGKEYAHSLFGVIVASGSIIGISILLGNEGLNAAGSALRDNVGGGLVGNSSLAGGYLLLVLTAAVMLLVDKTVMIRTKWWISIGIFTILFSPIYINLIGLLTSKGILGSARGAILGIGIAIGSTLLWKLIFSRTKIFRWIGIGLMAVSCLLFAFGWKTFISPESTIHKQFVTTASGTRFIFWDVSQKVLNDHPWFGYGPENFMIAFQHYFNSDMLLKEYGVETWTDRAHNVYYDTGVSGGYPLIALYVLFLLTIFYGTWKNVRDQKITQWQGAVIAGALFGYVFQNLFYFDSVLSWMVLACFAGITYGLQGESGSPWRLPSRYKNGIAVFCFAAFATVWIPFAWMQSRKSHAIAKVLKAPVNERLKGYSSLLNGSSMGNDWDIGGLAHDLYNTYASNPAQTKQNAAVMKYAEQDLTNLLQYLEEVHNRNPFDMRLTITMVHLYSTYIYLFDKPLDNTLATHMLDLLHQADVLSPNNPEVYWGIAQVKIWQGKYDQGRVAYEHAIAINPRVPVSHQLLIQYAQIVGDKKLAAAALFEAQKNIPGFTLNQ